MARLKRVWFKVGLATVPLLPWLPKLMDRLAHMLDLGCTGLH